MIVFSYRNMTVSMDGYACNEADVSYDFLEDLARVGLEKLENAALEDPENTILTR